MKSIIISAILSFVVFISVSSAADLVAGQQKSAVCSACHGLNGVGTRSTYPNLAGQKEQYLIKQIKAFRDGIRKDITMQPMVAPLTDTDIANLAAYYASLPPKK